LARLEGLVGLSVLARPDYGNACSRYAYKGRAVAEVGWAVVLHELRAEDGYDAALRTLGKVTVLICCARQAYWLPVGRQAASSRT
jgi:hypothetical protein